MQITNYNKYLKDYKEAEVGILENIIKELSKDYITEHIEKPHNEARISFHLTSNSVPDDASFENLIGEYYNHHFTKCVSNGGELTRAEATGRAKEIITENYRRRRLDKLNAYSDGINGSNGGMMAIIDIIMEQLKNDAKERHVQEVIDRYIARSRWEEQVEIIKELFDFYPKSLNVDRDNPERYARNYEELIKALMESLNGMNDNLRKS